MNRTAFIALALVSILFLSATSRAALTFDLRAVSGSRVAIIQGPKSVAVNHDSVGGWIDFELYAFVNGSNDNPDDESIHSFVGNMLSTQFGHGVAGGSMVNSGEITPRVLRGIVPPLDHNGSSNGTVQNLDDDPDLEIGGTGADFLNGTLRQHPIVGRGDPFRVRNYEGDGAVAEFLLYRFTLPIESFLGQSPSDITSVQFAYAPQPTYLQWFEDGEHHFRGDGRYGIGVAFVNEPVLIHTAQTPEELAAIPEPSTWALALLGIVGASWVAKRRRRR